MPAAADIAEAGRGPLAILLPDLRGGGAERLNLHLAEEFLRRGHGVDLVVLRAEGPLLADVPAGGRLVDLKARRFRHALGPLARYLRARRPAALLASMWPLTGIAAAARLLAGAGTRLVLAEHTHLSRSEAVKGASDLVNRGLGRALYGRAEGVVAVSEGVKADLVARTGLAPEAVSVIYNPVRRPSPDARGEADLLAWWKAAPRAVIAVGALKPAKDYPTLFRAFVRFRETADARLLVLGEGPLRGELEALAASLGLADQVRMPGAVPDPYPYLGQADLFVLSSAWEGLGNAVIEALVAGTQVVSTDCPSGPAEILEDGRHGRLAPVGDAEALARAMHAALEAPIERELLMRRGAEFSIERAADQYLALLDPRPGA